MADVQAIFGTLLALGIAFPGLLATNKLLMPRAVGAARERLTAQPGRCFGRGLLRVTLIGLAVFALLASPAGPLKLLGVLLGLAALAWAAIGAAGLAEAMGERIRAGGETPIGPWRAFLAGAVAMEMAVVFPAVGWFILLPLMLVACAGAAPRPLRAPWRVGRALRVGLAAAGEAGAPSSPLAVESAATALRTDDVSTPPLPSQG